MYPVCNDLVAQGRSLLVGSPIEHLSFRVSSIDLLYGTDEKGCNKEGLAFLLKMRKLGGLIGEGGQCSIDSTGTQTLLQ